MKKISRGLNPTQRSTGNWIKLEVFFFRKEHTSWLPRTKWSKNNIVHNLLIIFRNIIVFTNTNMLAKTINEKRCHNFEGEREGCIWEGLDGGKEKENFN